MASTGTYDNLVPAGESPLIGSIATDAVTYRVYNIRGVLMEEGEVVAGEAEIAEQGPGWRIILFEGVTWIGDRGYIKDSLQITFLRADDRLPPVPALGTDPCPQDPNNRGIDIYMHAVTGMGPVRWQIRDAANPTVFAGSSDQGGTIATVEENVVTENDAGWSSPDYADPARPHEQLVHFGTTHQEAAGYSDGVAAAVAALGPGTDANIKIFEGLNEPNGQEGLTHLQSAAQFNTFRAAVKAGNPAALAAGPCEVAYAPTNNVGGFAPQMSGFETFLANITPGSLDVATVHNYNSGNGDFLVTDGWIGALRAALVSAGYPADHPLWYTETGFIGMGDWGLFDPIRGCQWTAGLMMTGERWGVPKEHQLWFYDSHLPGGPVTSWLKELSGDLRPFATFFRVYSEEHFGKAFDEALVFGEVADKFYRGNVCRGAGGTCLALMAQGNPEDTVTLEVSDAGPITYSDWEGATSTAPVVAGRVTLPIGDLPIYVRLSAGCSIDVIDVGNGLSGDPNNVALDATVSTRSGALFPERINNDAYGTGGYLAAPDAVFVSETIPEVVELEWEAPQQIDKVLIRQLAPWINYPAGGASAMVEARLEYWNGSGWLPCPTVERAHWDRVGRYNNDTADSFIGSSGAVPGMISFYDQNWCHNVDLSEPITTTRLRLVVTRTTYGELPDFLSLRQAPYNLASYVSQRLTISQIAVFSAEDAVPPTFGPFPAP